MNFGSLGQWLLDAGKTAQGYIGGNRNNNPPPAPSQPPRNEMPAWLLPVGIGLGLLVVLVMLFKK